MGQSRHFKVLMGIRKELDMAMMQMAKCIKHPEQPMGTQMEHVMLVLRDERGIMFDYEMDQKLRDAVKVIIYKKIKAVLNDGYFNQFVENDHELRALAAKNGWVKYKKSSFRNETQFFDVLHHDKFNEGKYLEFGTCHELDIKLSYLVDKYTIKTYNQWLKSLE